MRTRMAADACAYCKGSPVDSSHFKRLARRQRGAIVTDPLKQNWPEEGGSKTSGVVQCFHKDFLVQSGAT